MARRGGALVLTLFVNADLGVRNDFDLLSPFAVPAYVVSAIWLDEARLGTRGPFVALSLAATAVLLLVAPGLTWPD